MDQKKFFQSSQSLKLTKKVAYFPLLKNLHYCADFKHCERATEEHD